MALHRPPKGETMVTHEASENCPCKPERITVTKRRSTGGFGRHQGFSTGVIFQHKPMPKNES